MSDFLESLRNYAKEVPAIKAVNGFAAVQAQIRAANPQIPAPEGMQDMVITKGGRLPDIAQQRANELNQITEALKTPQDILNFNLSLERNNGLTAGNQMANEFKTLTPLEFHMKYGSEALRKMQAMDLGSDELNRLANSTKSPVDHVRDAALDVASGAIQGLAGAQNAVLRSTVIGEPIADYYDGLADSVKKFTDSLHSNDSKRLDYVDSVRGSLDKRDNAAIYEQEKKDDGAFVASIRDIGRNAYDSVGRLGEDPTQIAKGVAEGAGSLLIGGPLSKGVALTAKVANKAVAPLMSPMSTNIVNAAIEKVAFPLTIGAMEGGSAAKQSYQEVMSMDPAQLQALPEYQEMLKTMSPEDAQLTLAHRASRVALPIAGAVGAVTGKLVEGIEKAPFAATTAKTLIADMAKEGVEEGAQSISGQVASNLGVKLGANPDKNLTEDVGESLVEGALFGSLTPAVTQTPGLAVKTTGNVVAAPFKYAVKKGIERYEAIRSDLEKKSNVSEENVAASVAGQDAKADEVLNSLVPTEGDAEAPSYLDRVKKTLRVDELDLANLPATIRDMIVKKTTAPNKFDAIQAASAVANDEGASEEDRIAAGTFVLKNIEDNNKTLQEDYPEFLAKADPNSPQMKAFNELSAAVQSMGETPIIKKVLKWARETMQMSDRDLTGVLNTPEGAKIVSNAVDVATYAPQAMNPNVANQILNQADERTIDLTREQRAVLRSAIVLKDTPRILEAQMRAMEPMVLDEQLDELSQELDATKDRDNLTDIVSKQVFTDGGPRETQLSLLKHVEGINLSASQGDMATTKLKLQHLADFAQSHINKVAAGNASIVEGKGRDHPYEALSPTGFYTPEKGYGIHVKGKGAEGSQKLARKVYAEATALAAAANGIIAQYPEFGIEPKVVPALALDMKKVDPTVSEPATPPQATTAKTESVSKKVEPTSPKSQQSEDIGTTASPDEAASRISKGSVETKSSDKTIEQVVEAAVEKAIGEMPQQNAEPVTPEAPTEESAPKPAKAEPRILPNLKPIVEPAPVEATVADETVTPENIVEQLEALEEDGAKDLVMKDVFPKLVAPKGRNWFWETFRLSKQPKSRLSGLEQPFIHIYRLMTMPAADIVQFMDGKDTSYDVRSEDREALRGVMRLGGLAINNMNKQLQNILAEKKLIQKTGKIDPSFLESFAAGDDSPLRYRDKRVLNLVELNGEKSEYNPVLLQSAVIAGLDWLLNAQDQMSKMDADDVAKLLGLTKGKAAQYVADFNRGGSIDMAVQSLSTNIQKFWDVSKTKNARKGYTTGIPEAMAKEILEAFKKAGLLSTGSFKAERMVGDTLKEVDFGRVWFDKGDLWERSDEINKLIESVSPVSHFFADVSLTEPERIGYSIGAKIKKIDGLQLHSTIVKVSDQGIEALKNAQNAAYYPNTEMYDLMTSMGIEEFVSQASGYPYKTGDLQLTYDKTPYNKGHWKSIQGKQQSYYDSYKNVVKQMQAVERYATKQGIPVSDVPIYYQHRMNSLGRPQMVGSSNPQSDKFAREVFLSTGSTIDLSSEDTADFASFIKTIAQGIGEKTEKLSDEDLKTAVEDKVMKENAPLYPLVQDVIAWLNERTKSGNKTVPSTLAKGFAEAKLTQHGVSSIVAVARYMIAEASNADLSKFRASNYMEADGKTNGAANALATMSSGPPNIERLTALGKVGAFVGRIGKTLNDHYKIDKADLYQATSGGLVGKLNTMGEHLKANEKPEVHQHFQRFIRLLTKLNVNVSTDEKGDLVIERGLAKNPLTITIYGSGPKGIADNITNELLTILYEKLSESIATGVEIDELLYPEKPDQFNKDLDAMFFSNVVEGEVVGGQAKSPKYVKWVDAKNLGKWKDFELKKEEFDRFSKNVRAYLVDPMVASIEENVTQHTGYVTGVIQEATQIQSIFLKNLFIKEVVKRIATMQANPEEYDYRGGEFLSDEELADIMKELMKFAPMIDTGTQAYMLSGGEKSELFSKVKFMVDGKETTVSMPETFSTTLSGQLSTPAKVEGLTVAGVRAIPVINIGSGDAQMMINFLSEHADAAQRVLHVFDGLNIPADKIADYSTKINEAVFKTWTSNYNPVQAVLDTLDTFIEADPAKALFSDETPVSVQKAALADINIMIHGPKAAKEKTTNPEQAMGEVALIRDRLAQAAVETNATRRLYAEMPFTVDQMAGGKSPFMNKGTIEIPEGATDAEIVRIMQVRYEELLQEELKRVPEEAAEKIEPTRKSAAPAVEGAKQKFVEAVEALTTEDGPARVLKASDLNKLEELINKSGNGVQKEMAKAAINLLNGSTYRIVFGTPEELDAWESMNNKERFISGSNGYFGKIDPVAQLIMISNTTPETIVHELIHAATIDKVRARFDDPSQLSDEDIGAVDRLESLMGEWLDHAENENDWSGYEAQQMARFAIYKHLDAGRKAEAINEFMAWVLSNNYLADRAQSVVSKSTLSSIVASALDIIKSFFWGRKLPKEGDKILSRLRFNTRILMATKSNLETFKEQATAVALYQSDSFGSNERLVPIRQSLDAKLMAWINGDIADPVSQTLKDARKTESDENLKAGRDIAASFAQFFPGLMNPQGASTFALIQMALMTDIELNANALTRIEEMYTHVMKNIEVRDFRTNDDIYDQADATRALERYNVLSGLYITRTDRRGRSSLMSSFLALATVDDDFRRILNAMEKPKADKSGDRTLDGRLEDMMAASVDRVSLAIAGEKGSDISVKDAIDSLMKAMINNVGDQRLAIERSGENFLNRADTAVANWVQDKSDILVKKSKEVRANTNSRIIKAAASLTGIVGTIINEDSSQIAAQGLVSKLNQRGGFEEIRALVNDLVARTKDNAHVVDMISLVRSTVQQVRQRFREELPRILAKKFTKAPSQEKLTSMFKAFGKTDMAFLAQSMGTTEALALVVDQDRLLAEIARTEASIQAADPSAFRQLKAKSEQLANYMNTGVYGNNLLTNAEAISRLLDDPRMRNRKAQAPQLVDDIDKLVSLYAVNGLSSETRTAIAEMSETETEGLEFTLSYLVGQRNDEMAKIGNNNVALLNHYKGHIPSEAQQGGSLIIKDTSEEAHWLLRGYKRVADYNGSSADRYLSRKAYYFSPVSSTAPFNQGVLQTVHTTVSGVDPETGYTMGEVTAGRITGGNTVQLTQRLLRNPGATTEHLRPVWGEDGSIAAYERMADPVHIASLNKSTDLFRMIGAWHGRQLEEILAKQVNETQVDRLYDDWIKNKAKRRGEYVNIAKLKKDDDPVLFEAAKLVPRQVGDYVASKFGPDEFWVRRDVALDVFGARQASVGDMFSGDSRWGEAVTSKFEKLAIAAFGVKAYPGMVSIEKNVQELVANFKTTIVVRSVIVPVANLVSNMGLLLNRGVPLREVLQGIPRKTAEINSYVKSRNRLIMLEADLRSAQGKNDMIGTRRLSNEIKSIEDSHRRLTIWPLIQAGEFSAISNGQIQVEDLALADGKWGNWMERKIAGLPTAYREPLRYGLVTRDTALFKGLARATQYGDFVAKAVLYDHLTKREKLVSDEAIATAADAFVNYNRPMGRGRQYLESIGLLWFYNYKIRIMKEAVYTLRHHPLRSLLMSAVPIGLPIKDNILALGWDGDLGFSIGPSMGLNSFNLNPWINISR